MNRTKVTIQDIAEAANVSIATVSRVINNSGKVKDNTRIRVLTAARDLHFDIGSSPISLLLSELEPEKPKPDTKTGFLVFTPSITNSFYGSVIDGIQSAAIANHADCLVIPRNMAELPEHELRLLIYGTNVSGIITFSLLPDTVLKTDAVNIPIVQCSESDDDPRYSSIGIDDYTASVNAMEHILGTGKTKVAFINGPANYRFTKERQQAYVDTMKKHGLPINPQWMIQLPSIGTEMAYSTVIQLLLSKDAPNAFFTISDSLAATVILAAKHAHLHIPNDLVVVGFDDVEISRLCSPTITTISQPKFSMGYSACEMLLEKIYSPQAPVKHTKMGTELLIRGSTYSQFTG